MLKSEIVNFVRSIPNGRMVGITWVKADGSIRNGAVCFGVQKPTFATKPGEGIRKGVGFTEAVQNGVLKFFDPNAETRNGHRGDYRSARLDRILKISYNGEHIIEDNQHLLS